MNGVVARVSLASGAPYIWWLWLDADELQQLLSMFPTETGTGRTIDYLNELFTTKSN